jgi:hypothetical protein
VISGVPCVAQGDENRVTFDYAMVEKGIEWLEWIASGAPEKEIKASYQDQIATTARCSLLRAGRCTP